MKQYNITLKKIAISTSVIVKSIPLRLYTTIKHKIVLVQHNVEAALKKTAFLEDHKTILASIATGVWKTIFEKARNDVLLDSEAGARSTKYVGTNLNKIEIASMVEGCHLTRYRLLGEMDANESVYLDLATFDDMTLEDVDYVTI